MLIDKQVPIFTNKSKIIRTKSTNYRRKIKYKTLSKVPVSEKLVQY